MAWKGYASGQAYSASKCINRHGQRHDRALPVVWSYWSYFLVAGVSLHHGGRRLMPCNQWRKRLTLIFLSTYSINADTILDPRNPRKVCRVYEQAQKYVP